MKTRLRLYASSMNAPLVFDASVQQWVQLLCGHTICIIPDSVRQDGNEFLAYLTEQQVEVLDCTPTQLSVLFDSGLGQQSDLALQRVLVGGEAINSNLWSQLASLDSIRFYNMYGPTETTVDVVICRVMPGLVPILGRPVMNTQAYVLDETGQAAPVAVAGELYIGGAGVSRGYLGKPGQTAEKFVPDAFGAEIGGRLYRTGDRIRWQANGNLEFFGRIDRQVKLRGYRIELGEIEAVLSEHAGVAQCAVIMREGEAWQRQLVGYFVPASQPAPTAAQLREYLRSRLPEYMVPAAVIKMTELPLTASGKLNRRALPAPQTAEAASRQQARTAVEEILLGIWSDVLGREDFGVEDNFFELGGHSLLATQVISRIRAAFGVDLPLVLLFESPTIVGLATRVQAGMQDARPIALPPICPVTREGKLPLSFAQQRLWFIHQLEPSSNAYNIPYALHLRGAVDIYSLKNAINEIARRHEVLRTSFPSADGIPLQLISPTSNIPLPIIDLTSVSMPMPLARSLAHQEFDRPFDLENGPVLRALLIALRPDEFVLSLTIHHIAADGWSVGILIREFSALYQAFLDGRSSPLEELAVQYGDFAVWQRRWLRGEVLEEQLSYWKRELEGLERLEMPTDYARPAMAGHRGGLQEWVMGEELAEKVKRVSRQEGVTVYMTLLGGLAVLLSRYSGQSDIAIGTDVANRNQMEAEGLIGYFINQLVMRVRVRGEWTYREMMRGVREVTLGGYANQDLPFEKLVEEMEPERDLARSPLFDVKLVLQNMPYEDLRLGKLQITRMQAEHSISKHDLTLLLNETEKGLEGAIEYDTDLFEAQTIRRFLRHYEQTLTWLTDNLTEPINALVLTSDVERADLLAMASGAVRPRATSLAHDLIGAIAEHLPDATALIADDVTLTFADFNARANQVARYLRRTGVSTETPVGLCLERGVMMMVGLLGILKSGAAYVPLDPSYPAERLSAILDDIQSPVLLTESRLQSRLPAQFANVICLDTDWDLIAAESTERIESAAMPDSLAYVIYTSGSTGKPKGVAVSHQGLSNYLAWCLEGYDLKSGRGAPLHSSISFDLTVTSLFTPLLVGKPVVLLDDSAEALARTAEQQPDFSFVKLTPAHLNLLNVTLSPEHAAQFARQLIIGGEALAEKSLMFWRKYAPNTRLINEYGPTETVVGCCVFDATDGAATEGMVLIGKPISNTEAHVFDEQGHLAPIGVWGELHIGGLCLARGYMKAPALTAERFVPHPFGDVPGSRLYRTGDRVRWKEHGNLEFQGRTDGMVKLRGYRIELGEIEVTLAAHAGVRECVVVVQGAGADDPRLIAYFVPADGHTSTADLREHLQSKLPDYSVPGLIVPMESLPLTSNGKVDRMALAKLRQQSPEEPIEQLTPEEAELASIWAEVLDCGYIGPRDNFFELGGHSLLAAQVIMRVRDSFGVELPLRTIFEGPTVTDMAHAIAQAQSKSETRAQMFEFSLPLLRDNTLLERVDELSEAEVDFLLKEASGEID